MNEFDPGRGRRTPRIGIPALVMAVGGMGTSAANKSIARDNKRSVAALSLRADTAAESGTGTTIRCFADINREAEHRRAHSSTVCFAGVLRGRSWDLARQSFRELLG